MLFVQQMIRAILQVPVADGEIGLPGAFPSLAGGVLCAGYSFLVSLHYQK